MKRHRIFFSLLIGFFAFCSVAFGQGQRRIVHLSWKNVVDLSLKENLSLKTKSLEYDAQSLEAWKSLTYFLPSFSYLGIAQHNIELPVLTFMGQRFVVGTPYMFQHSLSVTLPLYTSGSRWFNYDIQQSLKKSLQEELEGKEEETVLTALQAYYGVILAQELAASAEDAASVAQQNLEQVRKFYDAGAARELDYQRAQAQYSSTLPMLESALANRQLSLQRLKTVLNIPLTDSLVVADSLQKTEFLGQFASSTLDDFKKLAGEHRNDVKAMQFRRDAANTGTKMALGQFTPTLALTASVDHAAPLENSRVQWGDYIRSKSLMLSLSFPLFEGGRRILDWQIAKTKAEQAELWTKQAEQGADLSVEQSYYHYLESAKSLQSQKDALDQYQESLRISNLLYAQGMSNQLDVLNAQLLYTQSRIGYLQGVYNYNVSQLELLQSIGLLDSIWK